MNANNLNSTTNEAAILAAVKGIAEATALLAQHSAALAATLTGFATAGGGAVATLNTSHKPSVEQCREPQNKIGVNLSPRGTELIYRLYDNGSSVRAASIAMAISHRAAKWRKGSWEKAGGLSRPRTILDID